MANSSWVDTTGLDRAHVLCALVNGTKPLRMGYLHPNAQTDLTYDVAKAMIDEQAGDPNPNVESSRYYFDYVHGRPIKVNLRDETGFSPGLYDRDAGGAGSAEGLIARLRFRLRDHK